MRSSRPATGGFCAGEGTRGDWFLHWGGGLIWIAVPPGTEAEVTRIRGAIAAGNIGCMTQIASGTGTPVLHTVELLDWATGGPRPEGLRVVGS